MIPGLDLHCTDPAQRFLAADAGSTAVDDIADLDHDLSDGKHAQLIGSL